ncbi:MAG TPA: Asp-tRNA(Asn)/Glu-tRNA(Gln) amidotransferase subunit GatB [Bacillota bacterium]|nr:Asp-tRNA(Asn)/Glu-tRNA(Gln) amidotransferase subunit GatB [Bacillota bacterium]HPW40712.1 Asp-tRNA(Asn)/Glu-tRNA(Gln) amidotransferase subunit GatB [Bacillota bacterium]
MSFETVIGLEIHAELNTKSKLFCSCPAEFGAKPNGNTCPVCLGLPGTLPVLNEGAVVLAVKAGLILNCEIMTRSRMDRKNYFYPDLPKAYQTTQYDIPICRNGYVDIGTEELPRRIRLTRIHLEEDAGKLIHLEESDVSLIDYNRAGIPLIEIVTEPDLRSAEEAVAFLKALKSMLEYGEISDCRMERGSLRCDANISLRKAGQNTLNTRVELKNMNSFKELQKALESEEERQRELYSLGEESRIVQETRRWDSAKGKTVPMRSKEDAHDYRYFPEPDLGPVIISDAMIREIRESLPEMPADRKKRFRDLYGLKDKEIDIIVGDKALSEYYEALTARGTDPRAGANWILGSMLKLLKEKGLEAGQIPVPPEELHKLIRIIKEGKISLTAGQEVFSQMFDTGRSAGDIIKEKGLSQISDRMELGRIITGVLDDNPQSLSDYAAGKTQAAVFLMGQIMKATKGRANPQLAREILEEKLKKGLP